MDQRSTLELGAHDSVADKGFIQKWGASFTTANGEADQYADFSQACEVPRPQTYQVPRATFDQCCSTMPLVVERKCCKGTRCEGPIRRRRGDRLVYCAGWHRASVRAAAVIDASGRAGFIAKLFGTAKRIRCSTISRCIVSTSESRAVKVGERVIFEW